jgi:hypothetical protein
MITEHQEIARYRVAEQLQAAEARRRGKPVRKSRTRHGLATMLHRLADHLEPASRRLTQPVPQPQPGHRGTGLSVVR